jgi:hypothetical protein
MSPAPAELLDLKASTVIADPQRPAKLDAMLSMRGSSSGQFAFSSEGLPLPLLDPILGRFVKQTRLEGRLLAKLNGQWGGEAGKTEVQGDLNVDGFALGAQALGADQLKLERLRADLRASGNAQKVQIEQTTFRCDAGELSLGGTLDLARPDKSWLDLVLHQTYELEGRVDLARLAALLPNTLRIRSQTRITAGQAEIEAKSRRGDDGMQWQARIEAKDLRATDQGREFAWEQPIALTLDARETPKGPVVDVLKCESDFLKFNGSGTFDDLAGSASFDLKRLADELGQFVDLGTMQLSGEGWAHGHWKRSDGERFESQAELQVRNFQFQSPGQKPWTEENVMIYAAAKGKATWQDLSRNARLDEAVLNLRTANDQLDAELSQPVERLENNGLPLKVQMSGRLESWLPRLAVWLPLSQWKAAGAYQFNAEGTANGQKVQIRDARLTITPLQVAAPLVTIDEPRVEATVAGTWDQQRRKLQVDSVTLSSATAVVQGKNLTLALPATGPVEVVGVLNYQADIARVCQWLLDRTQPRAWSVGGVVVGNANVQPERGGLAGQIDADLTNLTVTDAAGTPFTEPRVHLTARGAFDPAAKLLRIERAELTSAALAMNLAGRVEQQTPGLQLALDGQLGYDLDKLTSLLRPYLGPRIRVAGRGASPLAYQGTLDPATARGQAGLKWDAANLYGFPVGPAELKARLGDGWLTVEPIEVEASGGRLSLAPRVRLSPAPAELLLPAGKLAEQVQITPEMCASGLKYAMPMVADATEAHGTFSIELEGARVPLADFTKADVAGRLLIHAVEVGPGPLLREISLLLGQIPPGKLRRESIVPFRVAQGRVYHQGMELIFPEFTIRTQGSVGFDQSLAILAELPVPAKWTAALGDRPIAQALRNQTLRVPIGGTLSRPALDRSVVDQLGRQFMQNAAQGAVQNVLEGATKGLDDAARNADGAVRNVLEREVGGQLERLFGPSR